MSAFGRVTAFVVNYSPDRAVRFDLDGSSLEVLPRAVRPGRAWISVGGSAFPPEFLEQR